MLLVWNFLNDEGIFFLHRGVIDDGYHMERGGNGGSGADRRGSGENNRWKVRQRIGLCDNEINDKLRWRVSARFIDMERKEKNSCNFLPEIVASSKMEEKGI
jgi:ABC-type molybdenum transport system ATPase subunit/photorepair protein PhrA